MARELTLVWGKVDPAGSELALTTRTRDRLRAVGVAIHDQPTPHRLDYRLETGPGFVTRRLRVTARGAGWRRDLDLRRTPGGRWSIVARAGGDPRLPLPPPGGEARALRGALDCDLGFSPLTNTLPVLRLGLLREPDGGRGQESGPQEPPGPPGPSGQRPPSGARDILVAWVSVPDLRVVPDAQRYTPIPAYPGGGHVVRFENDGGAFRADLVLDDEGFVLAYPDLAQRLTRASPIASPG